LPAKNKMFDEDMLKKGKVSKVEILPNEKAQA
jgi:hypothetical protein